jgi:sugar phosphate isomerase/epimerase
VEKILNCSGLGVSGRQNELIELALTHKFDAVEIDMADLLGRHDALGKEFACQFLLSAKMNIGTFRLPIDLEAADDVYQAQAAKVDTILELAEALNGKRCYVRITPDHETLSFQENFERHRARLADLAEKFAAKDIKIGLLLQASPELQKQDFKFIQTTEEVLTLVKTVGHANVGVCLDTWNWVVGQGAMDQLSELTADQITEVRLADVPNDADVASIKPSQMVLAGESDTSIVPAVLKQLATISYEGPVSVLTNSGMLGGRSKNSVVGGIAKQLGNLLIVAGLIEGEIEEEASATPEGEEGEATPDGDAKTEKKPEPAKA